MKESKPCEIRSISFVLSSLKFGGAERVALNLAHALKEAGIKVDFLLMSLEGEFLVEAKKNFNVIDLRCSRTWKLPGKLATYVWLQKPDALIASFWKLNLCACLARLARPQLRLLLWEHSPPSKSNNSPIWLYAITASLVYRMATRVIAVSSGVEQDIARVTVGLTNQLQVIFNAIPPPSGITQLPAVREGGKKILWVGRMDTPKNPLLMLEAFSLLPADRGYTLSFVGDGALRLVLEKRSEALGLADRVHFLGFQTEPYEWMVQSDLLALTSDREGLGNVLIEALYCGLRVVSTDCGRGIHDILLDNCYGTVVPTGDPSALAKAITEALDAPCFTKWQIGGAQRFLPVEIARQFQLALNS
jgi:glycosyltransferase involved in cell wall biosynthesis